MVGRSAKATRGAMTTASCTVFSISAISEDLRLRMGWVKGVDTAHFTSQL